MEIHAVISFLLSMDICYTGYRIYDASKDSSHLKGRGGYMTFYILLFDDFESLDVFGPVEIFGRLEKGNIRYISMEGGKVTGIHGVEVYTDRAEKLPKGSVLLVPGGMGTRPLSQDEDFLKKLKDIADTADYVLSVCTGSALLAAAGLLEGVRATSNKFAFDWVTTTGKALWVNRARWVHDGRYYTSSGVSAGIDMALGFVADRLGRKAAEDNARRAEYIWNDSADDDPFADYYRKTE